MTRFSRRSLLVGSAALAGGSAWAAPRPAPEVPRSGNVDVVIVGAGAAGIAAARKLVAAGRRVAILEAAEQIGGRCLSHTSTLPVPFYRGAPWLYLGDIKPAP